MAVKAADDFSLKEPHNIKRVWSSITAKEDADFTKAKSAPLVTSIVLAVNKACKSSPEFKGSIAQTAESVVKTKDLALKLIEAVVNAVDIPVTLKTRLGWDHNDLNAADLSSSAEKIGIQMITIHGRTRCQFYKGDADWRKIREVKEAVNIPVIANGDIIDTPTAKLAMKQSKADGVMIGRGAQGKPWLLSHIASEIFNTKPPEIPSGNKLLEMISNHYLEMLNFYGEQHGNKVARKHLGWYMDYIGVNPIDRRALQTETDPQKVLSMISSLSATEDNPCQ